MRSHVSAGQLPSCLPFQPRLFLQARLTRARSPTLVDCSALATTVSASLPSPGLFSQLATGAQHTCAVKFSSLASQTPARLLAQTRSIASLCLRYIASTRLRRVSASDLARVLRKPVSLARFRRFLEPF